jgi:hypothetical protein
MKERGWHVGMGQRQNPYLIIPLAAEFHVGNHGIDYGMGVKTWEETFGTQEDFLDVVSGLLRTRFNYPKDVWELAEAYAGGWRHLSEAK